MRTSVFLFFFIVLMDLFPLPGAGPLSDADSLLKERKYEPAIEILVKALKTQPDDAALHVKLAEAYMDFSDGMEDYNKRQKLVAQAIDEFNRTLDLDMNNIDAYYGRGRCYWFSKKIDDAIADLEFVCQKKPDHFKAVKDIGNCYFSKGMHDKAIEYYQKSLKINPDYFMLYNNIGTVHASRDDDAKALENYDCAVKMLEKRKDPNPADIQLVFINRGKSFMKMKQWEKAISDFKKAVGVKTGNADFESHGLIMKCIIEMGKKEDAVTYCKETLKKNPDNADLINNLAVGFMDLKMYEAAEKLLKRALKLDPANKMALYNMGIIAGIENGDYQKGMEYIDKFIQIAPGDVNGYIVRGKIQYNADFGNEALKDFEEALKLSPDDAELYALIGYSNLKIGYRTFAAREAFEKALQIKPDYDWAKEGLGYCDQ